MPVLLVNLVVRAVNNPADLSCTGNPADQRTLWEIFWSCVVTIFACTWVTVHPNIPAADDTRLIVDFRRARLMLCGLVAPEIIILWAMRQWYSARKIAQAHKGVFSIKILSSCFTQTLLSRKRMDDNSWVFSTDGGVYDARWNEPSISHPAV